MICRDRVEDFDTGLGWAARKRRALLVLYALLDLVEYAPAETLTGARRWYFLVFPLFSAVRAAWHPLTQCAGLSTLRHS